MGNLNWGIIGTGTIANEFASQFPKGKAFLYAVASRTEAKAEEFAGTYDVPNFFGTYDELIHHDDIDVVYVAVPHNYHYEFIMASLAAKKHVVCEKPITISKKQLDDAIALAEENDVYLFEAMTIHHMPLYKKIKEVADEKELGPLKMVQVNFGSFKTLDPSFYFFNKDLAGGALFDIGVYALNFARWFLSSKPEEILTIGNIHEEAGVDESSAIILRNKESELATVSLTFRAKMPKQGVVAYEYGYFTIDNYPRANRASFTSHDGKVESLHIGEKEYGLAYEVENITEIILNEESNPYLQYTSDVIDIMDQVREEWGLSYPFEK